MRLIDSDEVKKDFSEILERDYEDDYAKGFQAALVAVLRYKTISTPPNDPMTLSELREMEERPVWIERHDGGQSRWAIVGSFDSLYGVYFGTARGGLRLPYDDYGKTWLSYRRKPEEGTT